MAISKNNPAARDHQRLQITCPQCETEMNLIKRIPGGMFYVCSQDDAHSVPVSRGLYKTLPHQWVRK